MITRSGHDKEATCSEGNRNQAELRKDDRGGVRGREEMNETDRAAWPVQMQAVRRNGRSSE